MTAPEYRAKRGQEGVVLFVALIVLVVMALAGVAMVRQSGTGLSIAGNVAMKQNATSAGDLGTEAARAWWLLPATQAAGFLDLDNPAEGYFSDWGAPADPRRAGDPSLYLWNGPTKKVVTADDGTGNTVTYIIERLCLNPNQSAFIAGQLCVNTPISDGGNQSGSTCTEYPNAKVLCDKRVAIHYRISTKIVGPKNTVSYIQVMVE